MKNRDITKTAQVSLDRQKEKAPVTKPLSASSAQIRIPTQRPVPQITSKKKRETQQITKGWTPESAHTDHMSSQLPSTAETGGDLCSKKFQRFHLKKTKTVLQKIKDLHEKAQQKVRNKVSVMTSASEQKPGNNQDELWRDLMKPREERQFQIDRM